MSEAISQIYTNPALRIISGSVASDLFCKCAQGLFPPLLLQLAFPHSDDSPSHGIERLCRQLVTLDVILNLRLPELRIGLWPRSIPATAVSMPEAPVHEDACPVLRQHHIRTSRQLLHVDAEAESRSVEILTHKHLGPRVLGPDMRHAVVPLLGSHFVGHGVAIIARSVGGYNAYQSLPGLLVLRQ